MSPFECPFIVKIKYYCAQLFYDILSFTNCTIHCCHSHYVRKVTSSFLLLLMNDQKPVTTPPSLL